MEQSAGTVAAQPFAADILWITTSLGGSEEPGERHAALTLPPLAQATNSVRSAGGRVLPLYHNF